MPELRRRWFSEANEENHPLAEPEENRIRLSGIPFIMNFKGDSMHSIAEQFPIPAGKEAGMDHYAGMPNGGLCSASCMFVLLRHSKTERILN